MKVRGLMALATAAMLGGCANFAPPHERPTTVLPRAGQAAAQDAAALPWREFVTDERLRHVVQMGLDGNNDLAVAEMNLARARALYRVQDASTGPQLTAGAGLSRSKLGNSATVNLGLAAYELDLFGRVRNLGDAALQTTRATDETRRSVQLSLVAEIANGWLTMAADQARLKLAGQTLASQQRSFDLNTRRYQLGAITGLALAQAQTARDAARLDVANAAAQLAQDLHALELLVAFQVPESFLPGPDDSAASVAVLLDLPSGVPASVLQQRPDVRAAEHQLYAAQADVGVARAAMFPRIALTASAGRSSPDLAGLFNGGSGAWSFGPSLSVPLFDGGAGRANHDAAWIAKDIAAVQYERALRVAFREVADALSLRDSLSERLAAQASLSEAAERQLQRADALYRVGGTSQLELLDAQRTLYAAQQGQISLRLAEQTNRITLYKVLGGGSLEEQ